MRSGRSAWPLNQNSLPRSLRSLRYEVFQDVLWFCFRSCKSCCLLLRPACLALISLFERHRLIRADAILRMVRSRMPNGWLWQLVHHKGRLISKDKCLINAAVRGESCIEFAGISFLMAVMDHGGGDHHRIHRCNMFPPFLDDRQMVRLARLCWLARC